MPEIIYVDSSAVLGGTGTSWADAYRYLQDAIAEADGKFGPVQIWVARGTYYPDEDEGGNVIADDRSAAFKLKNNVSILGGFRNNAVNLNGRNWFTYPSILSGEITADESSYHVIENDYLPSTPLNQTAVLDGFVITRGLDIGVAENGGGMLNINSSPTIRNCHFIKNTGTRGGAIYNSNSEPRFENCIFSENFCNVSQQGNSIYNVNSPIEIVNCTFTQNNSSTTIRSNIYNDQSNIQIINTILWNNDIEILDTLGSATNISHSIVQGGFVGGVNVIEQDPMFFDFENDFRLKLCSPAINNGLNSASMIDRDYANGPRIRYEDVDIGAYEYVAERLYVNYLSTSGHQDGSSWENAFVTLQDALSYLDGCGSPADVWVARGTYYPDEGGSQVDNDRNASFTMLPFVKMYGGFLGSETSLNQRGLFDLPVLSGDIDGNNGNTDGDVSGNSRHVIYNDYTEEDPLSNEALLDGFIIAFGNADSLEGGGGIYNVFSHAVFRNCSVAKNISAHFGGGMYTIDGDPTFEYCNFRENLADRFGGGLYFRKGTSTFSNTSFLDNVVEQEDTLEILATSGAGLYLVDFDVVLNECNFADNEAISLANSYGGAIHFNAASQVVVSAIFNDCVFIKNIARNGAAIYEIKVSELVDWTTEYNDCHFLDNETTQLPTLPGGAYFDGGVFYIYDTDPVFRNCLFRNNTSQGAGAAIYNVKGHPYFEHSVFDGNRAHPNNGVDYMKGNGGAIYCGEDSDLTVLNCSFYRNLASFDGGAIFSQSTNNPQFTNCEFLDNRALGGRGWSVHNYFSSPEFINCSFGNSEFSALESFANTLNSHPTLANCIVWNHDAFSYDISGSLAIPSNCIIEGGYGFGSDIIDSDPLFRNLLTDDMSLQPCSPAIDTGSNSANMESIDIAENARLFDATSAGSPRIDLGAHEYADLVGDACVCLPSLKLDVTTTAGNYQAGQEIRICADIAPESSVELSAPMVNLESMFEIPIGATMEVRSDGCQ